MRLIRQSFKGSFILLMFVSMSCASSPKSDLAQTSSEETEQEALNALGAVAGSYVPKGVSEEELKDLARDINRDEEAQSAIRAIADSLEGKSTHIKYSPETGKRYSGDLEYDPETGVKLLPLEQ